MTLRLDFGNPDFAAQFTRLIDASREARVDVRDTVSGIIDAVRSRGDEALIGYTRQFDNCNPDLGGVIEAGSATALVSPDLLAALDTAATRIEAFHRLQLPVDIDTRDAAGVRMGMRWKPIDAVGLYVPGGKAAYPSSVLMNAIPARIAGVGRIVMVVPTPDGDMNPLVLAAAARAGVHEIYPVGGAQAIAALTYGTESISPVDKIVGPGNAYVAEAKRQVFGTVGIDMIAGPTEIVVIADRHNDTSWIAIDLLSQAEHDPAAQAILITDDPEFADAVAASIVAWLPKLQRSAIATASWRDHGVIITVPTLDHAATLSNRLAPEHLELAVADPQSLSARIDHAGSLFLGRYAPEAIGDYVAGPNHVLPTSRSARFSSGLSVFDFMKRTTWIDCGAEAIRTIGPDAVLLARAEGLEAHALSIEARLNQP